LFSEKEAVSLCTGAARIFVQDAEDRVLAAERWPTGSEQQLRATTERRTRGLSGLDAPKRKAGKFMQ